MKILAWNCRGPKGTSTTSYLKDLISSSLPDVTFILESRSNSSHIQYVANIIGYHNYFDVDANNRSGGLACFKSSHIKMTLHLFSRKYIIFKVFNNNVHYFLVCLYGEPSHSFRYNFWDHLYNILASLVKTFIIIGDFNDIDDFSDRLGGMPPDVPHLSNFSARLHLHNSPYSGPTYT